MGKYVQWITHKGKRILLVNGAGLHEAEYIAAMEEMKHEILKEREGAMVLVDATKTEMTTPTVNKAKEVAAAKQLSSDVKRNLAQKIPDIGDIPMPVSNTEGMTREEVKRSNFKGKSNIHYLLGNRYHLQLPIPVYLAQGGGEVVVDILVNKSGEVLSAAPRSNANISDPTILAYAKQAAEKTLFNSDNSAPEKEQGTITYLFVAQ